METIVIGKVTPQEFKFSVKYSQALYGKKLCKYEFQAASKRIAILPQAILGMELEINQHGDGALVIFTSSCKYEIHATSSYSEGLTTCYDHWLGQ